jgi:hypothetical protein
LPVEFIISKSIDESKPNFLVKWNQRSYLHCGTATDTQLRSGSHTHPLLKRFLNTYKMSGEICSELTSFFLILVANRSMSGIFISIELLIIVLWNHPQNFPVIYSIHQFIFQVFPVTVFLL